MPRCWERPNTLSVVVSSAIAAAILLVLSSRDTRRRKANKSSEGAARDRPEAGADDCDLATLAVSSKSAKMIAAPSSVLGASGGGLSGGNADGRVTSSNVGIVAASRIAQWTAVAPTLEMEPKKVATVVPWPSPPPLQPRQWNASWSPAVAAQASNGLRFRQQPMSQASKKELDLVFKHSPATTDSLKASQVRLQKSLQRKEAARGAKQNDGAGCAARDFGSDAQVEIDQESLISELGCGSSTVLRSPRTKKAKKKGKKRPKCVTIDKEAAVTAQETADVAEHGAGDGASEVSADIVTTEPTEEIVPVPVEVVKTESRDSTTGTDATEDAFVVPLTSNTNTDEATTEEAADNGHDESEKLQEAQACSRILSITNMHTVCDGGFVGDASGGGDVSPRAAAVATVFGDDVGSGHEVPIAKATRGAEALGQDGPPRKLLWADLSDSDDEPCLGRTPEAPSPVLAAVLFDSAAKRGEGQTRVGADPSGMWRPQQWASTSSSAFVSERSRRSGWEDIHSSSGRSHHSGQHRQGGGVDSNRRGGDRIASSCRQNVASHFRGPRGVDSLSWR
eukprot:TRINITY_DN37480_c0_g1_i1.p1 TRINITY_DN37480_c0_g1~~TRINITY_DN37480_c0_g1_i1.p1  ORF type:complete len:588 (+),score=109.42 TRINITY_DN37480_c0_g1_i1:70-1764(+)